MNKIKYLFGLFLLILTTQNALAMMGVNVIASSKTGRTIRLDIGKVDGLLPRESATASIRVGSLSVPKYIYLGNLELVQSKDRTSTWHFKKVNGDKLNPAQVQAGRVIHLQLSSKTTKGKLKRTPKYKSVAYESEAARRNNRYAVAGEVPSNLVQGKEVPNSKNYESRKYEDQDIVASEESQLVKGNEILLSSGRAKYKYVNSKLIEIDASELERNRVVNNSLKQQEDQLYKISSKKDGYDEMFYDGNVNLSGPDSKLSIPNVMSESLHAEKQKNKVSESTKAVIDKEGPLWSADMNSEQLNNYLKASGYAREKHRRENVDVIESSNELSFSIQSNLMPNYSESDPNHQNIGYGLAIGYEFHLVRASQSLAKWAVDFGYDVSNLNFDIGAANARMTLSSFSTHLIYYFYRTPFIKNKLQAYFGFGIKRGVGETTSSLLAASSYDYEAVALPSLTLGIKTRISTYRDYESSNVFGYGLGAKLNYEYLSLNPISEIDNADTGFALNTNVHNIKFIASLSLYF